ncbi:hypothetical protein ACTXPA_18475 [Glutamicibacter arilaitensis]|uniref:hypothetical protein n=1 Tax=Glutamicibacter arilaitensis TaxID=256701 RepID=UPI003FD0CEA1
MKLFDLENLGNEMANLNTTHINQQQLRGELASLTPSERADLLQETVNTFYDGAKFDYPGGEGLDGKDGPERRGIGEVLNAAVDYADDARATGPR